MPADPPPDAVTLHSSWRGIALSFVGSGFLAGVAIFVALANGIGWFTGVLLAVGLVIFGGIAFDYPIASTFAADRVERRSLLRRHRIGWDGVDQLTRTRPGFAAGPRRFMPGGLVAIVGRRRYLLTDQPESGEEHDRLVAVLEPWSKQLGLKGLRRPSDQVAPTWLYRRRRWRSED